MIKEKFSVSHVVSLEPLKGSFRQANTDGSVSNFQLNIKAAENSSERNRISRISELLLFQKSALLRFLNASFTLQKQKDYNFSCYEVTFDQKNG